MENKLYKRMLARMNRWVWSSVAIVCCLFTTTTYAQLTGTKVIPVDYPTLADAITDLNAQGVGAGGVIIDQTGIAETAPAGGYVINLTVNPASPANPVTITGNGAVITAPNPQASGSLVDAIFKIIGEDNVTIQGFSMLENGLNTTTAAGTNNMTEFGVALFYRTTTDGAQNCTIQNNTITLNRTYQNTWGIYSNSTHSATTITTSATATTATGGNSGLKIYGNTISNVNQGICVVGPTAAVDMNTGLDIGGSGGAQANSITNWGTTGTFSGYVNVSGTLNGILVRNSTGFNVSYNTITSSVGGNTATTSQRAIYIPSFSVAPTGTFTNTINNNSISVQSGFLTGTINGIINEGTTGTATSSIVINNNDFNNCNHTSATASGAMTFINSTMAHLNTTISNNTFTALSVKTTGTVTFVSNSITVIATGTQTVTNNNIVTSFTRTSAGTTTCFTTGSSSAAGATNSWSNNNFSNITLTGSSSFTFISNSDGGGVNTTISGNTLNNVGFSGTTVSTSTITGITASFGGAAGGAGKLVTGNTISNITSSGPITGIVVGSSGTKITATNNTINNLSSVLISGAGAGNVFGITVANPTADVNNNTITNLSTAGASSTLTGISVTGGSVSTLIEKNTIRTLSGSGATAPVANGISVSGGANVTLSNNVICDISETGAVNIATLNGCAVNGILLSGGTLVTAYNNRIGDLRAPSALITSPGVDDIRGVSITSTTASSSYKLHNNTINLTAAAGGPSFGTAAVFHVASATATTASLEMRNNILVNTSVHNGGGNTVVFRRSAGGTAGLLANYATTSDNNDFWTTGGGGALDNIYNDGTGVAFTYNGATPYKTAVFTAGAVAPRDQNSMSTAPNFITETCGAPNFLRLTAAVTTQLESGGNGSGLSFSTDFQGDARPGPAGSVNGGASAYDVGADEFDGAPATPTIATPVASPSTTQCVATSRTITVLITPVNPLASDPTLTYAYNGGTPVVVSMTGGSLNAASTWTATIPAATPGNATVTWSIFATDGTLSSSKAGATYADQPNDVAQSQATAVANPNPVCALSATTLSGVVGSTTPPSYTAPPAVTNPTTDEDFGNITITQGANTILNNTTAGGSLVGTIGTGTGTPGSYSDFSAFGPYVLATGVTYNLSVTSITQGGSFGNAMAVFIDYNRNGVFTDANEAVYNQGATISGPHTSTGSFTVPANASFGICRMRVLVNEGTISGPTITPTWGEYEEYSVFIAPNITSYSWSDGVNVVGTTNPLVVYPSVSTTYTVTGTANGCPITASVAVNTLPLPSTPTANNNTRCGLGAPNVSVTSTSGELAPTFHWYTQELGGSFIAGETGSSLSNAQSVSVTTTYYVAEIGAQCESQRVAVVQTVTQPDAISASATVASICPFTTFTLNVQNTGGGASPNTYTYAWTSATAGSGLSLVPTAGDPVDGHLDVQGTTSGVKTYIVTGTDGGCVTTSTVNVTINPSVLIDSIKAVPATICSGEPVALNLYSAVIGTGPQVLPGTYCVPTQLGGSCVSSVQINTLNSTPPACVSPYYNINPASGSNTTDLAAGQTYVMTLASSGASIISVWIDYDRNGLYDASEWVQPWTSASSGTVNISVPNTASPGLTGMRIRTRATGNTNGATDACSSFGSGSTEDYTVNLLSYIPQNNALTYNWTPGNLSGASVTVNPLNPGNTQITTTYTVQVDDNVNCTNYASVVVTVNPLPATPVANPPSTQCGLGVPTCSVVAGPNSYRWYLVSSGGSYLPGESGPSLSAYQISVPTTFYVSEWDGTCESGRVEVIANVDNPDAITASTTTPTCTATQFTLNVTKAAGPNSYTYSWNGTPLAGSGLAGPTPGDAGDGHLDITPTAPGTYTYTVTGTGGVCATTSSVVVTVSDYPVIDSLIAAPIAVCSGGLVTLNAYSSYIASGPQTPLVYTLPGTTNNNASDHITQVTFNTINNPTGAGPAVNGYADYTGSVAATTVSSGQSYTFSMSVSNGGTEYGAVWIDWNRNGSFDASEFTDVPLTLGTTWDGSASITVPNNAAPGVVVMRVRSRYSTALAAGDALAAYTYGETEDYLVNILGVVPQNPSLTYTWSAGTPGSPTYTATDNPTNNSAVPSISSYTVTVSNNGCSAAATVSVTVNPLPPTPVGQDDVQCGSGIPTCYVTGSPGAFFNWYDGNTLLAGENGANLVSYSISQTTTFYVAEWDGTCESNLVAVIQTVVPPPSITASAPSPVCPNVPLTLTVSNPGLYPFFSYDWTSNPSAGSGLSGTVSGDPMDGHLDVTPTTAGTYTYSVLASDGVCNSPASVVVTVSTPPALDSVVAVPTTVCAGSPVTLTAYSNVLAAGPQVAPAGYPGLSIDPGIFDDEQIFGVTFGTMVNNQAEACGTNYEDYTGTVAAPTVTAGTSVAFEVRQNECDGTPFYSNGFSIYIDLNRDGDWADLGEQVYTTSSTSAATGASPAGDNVRSGSILIPANASAGLTRMRVIMAEGVTSPTYNQAFNYGEQEDYLVNIIGISPTNPALSYTWSPAGGNTLSTTVNPTTTTTYTVSVSDGVCANSGSVVVNVNPLPPTPTANNSSQCGAAIPTCSVNGSQGGPFTWYLGPTGSAQLANESGSSLTQFSSTVSQTTTFYVAEFDGTCESERVPVIVTVSQPDPVSANVGAGPYCATTVINLTQSYTPVNNNYTSWSWTASPLTGSGLSGLTPGDLVDGHLDVTPTAAGTYTYSVLASDPNGCQALGSVVVTVGSIPPLTASASATQICEGSSTTLTAVSQVIGTGPQTLPGTYCVPVQSGSSCVSSVQINTLNSTPPACATPFYNINPATGSNTTTLTAGQTYTITLATTGASIISVWIDYDRNGVFDASEWVQPWTNASSGTASISVPGSASPGLTGMRIRSRLNGNTNGAGDACTTFGSGSTEDYSINIESLVPTPGVTFVWNPGALGNPVTVTPLASTTYVVTATDGASGCSASAAIPVTVINSNATPIISASTTDICVSGSSNLSVSNAEAGIDYLWEYSTTGGAPWTVLGTGTSISTGTISQSTTYQVTATCGANVVTSAPQLITVSNPQATAGTGGTRCGPGFVTATVTAGTAASYDWYSASTGGTLLFTNQTTVNYLLTVPSGILWVQGYTGACSGNSRFPISVSYTPSPSVSITAPASTCSNVAVDLLAVSANGGYTYEWSTDGGTTIASSNNPYNVNPAVTTTYTLIATDNSGGANQGCSNVATHVLSVLTAPDAPIITPANPVICSVGGCTDLTISNIALTQPTTASVTFNLSNPATDEGNGTSGTAGAVCPGNNQIASFVLPPIPGPVTSAKLTINGITLTSGSFGSEIRLSFSGSGIIGGPSACYQGATGTTVPNPTDWITGVPTTGDLAALGALLNTAGGTVDINYSDSYNDNISGPDATFPATATLEYTYLASANYVWNPGNLSGTTVNVCPTQTTTYTATITDGAGCSASGSVVVTYDPIPDPVITPGGSTTICPGGSVNLDAFNAAYTTYDWNDGSGTVSTSSSYLASPAATTTYTVTVSNGTCTKVASQVVTVANLTPPTVTVVNNDPTTFCQGGSVTLDAGAGYDTYAWSDGVNAVGTAQTLVVTSSGSYTVTVSLNGCSATSSATVVTVNPNPPTALITPAGPINLCSNGSNSPVVLTADITGAGVGATIVWNQDGNPTTNTINVSAGDIDLLLNGGTFGYNFTVTANGCSTTSNTVTVNEVPCGGATLYAKLFLEGYYSGSGDMNTSGSGGCLFVTGGSLNPLDADYVTLSAMSATSPYGLVESQTGVLKTDGTINVTFSNAVATGGSYYIKVTHRNALETWSANPVVLSATTALAPYDFSSGQGQAYGGNQSDLFDGNWAIFSGDISDAGSATVGVQDGIIESQDYGDMENAVYVTLLGYVTEDITGDGLVESADYGLMENNVYFTRVVQKP